MWQYIGTGGEFYSGVPARDLTAEEFAALAPDQQAAVQSGRLYRKASAKKHDPPAA